VLSRRIGKIGATSSPLTFILSPDGGEGGVRRSTTLRRLKVKKRLD
jgi:hypothetical protein